MAKYTYRKKTSVEEASPGTTLSPAQQDELKWLRDAFRSLGRRTTEQAYDIGDYLSRAKSILPEKALGAWVKAVCKFTPKTGRNYMAVYNNLIDYKERLVSMAVAPTVLFVLASADRSDIDRVITAIENGENLTVAQIKAMVGIQTKRGDTRSDDDLNVGGLAGLRKAAELKTTQDVGQFHGLMSAVLNQVEKAMEPVAKGRAVKKGELQDVIVYDCRHAHDLLNSIAAPMKAEMIASVNWRPARLPEGSAWRKVQALLHRMGGVDGWPDRSEFVVWLQGEVVPLLRFVVHGEALPSTEDDAGVVDKRDLAQPAPAGPSLRERKGPEVALAKINRLFNGMSAPKRTAKARRRITAGAAVPA